MATWNIACSLAFEVRHSPTDTGEGLTKAQLLEALERRLQDLRDSPYEIFEAVLPAYDAFEEDSS